VTFEAYRENLILRQLPRAELERLGSSLEHVSLSFKERLYTEGEPMRHVYFVTSGVVSLVVPVEDEQPIEAGTIGREGLVGLPAFLGMAKAPWRALCQVPGAGLRMTSSALVEETRRSPMLTHLLMRYANAVMSMLAQTAACNRAHSLEERMCRWVLMTHDRVQSDDFPLTQEFLGQMLGVRRPVVSLVGRALQNAGLIRYGRGRVAVLDREGLEEASCECYAIVQREFEEAVEEARPVRFSRR
jgi:CRP-like cAMP-binding protein